MERTDAQDFAVFFLLGPSLPVSLAEQKSLLQNHTGQLSADVSIIYMPLHTDTSSTATTDIFDKALSAFSPSQSVSLLSGAAQ